MRSLPPIISMKKSHYSEGIRVIIPSKSSYISIQNTTDYSHDNSPYETSDPHEI
jgi:hypothetical protein